MAVFTEVTPEEAQGLLDRLQLGPLQSMQGCASGIENTNYFVSTAQGEFVLTLFERLSFEQLPFYLQLMRHLAQGGIPVPAPQPDPQGEILLSLKGKPAAVVTRLPGRNQLSPEPLHCQQVGAMLARMHLAGQDFTMQQANLRGLSWMASAIPQVLPHLEADQAALITSELAAQRALAATEAHQALPRGPVHADLFRDNVMFDGPTLAGFFDFYFAGWDTLVLDIAVCLNDWCIDLDSGALDEARARALVSAYHAVRPLTAGEQTLLPMALRAAALRFWTSRLWDVHLPRDAAMLQPHDPRHFERVLRERVLHPWQVQGGFDETASS